MQTKKKHRLTWMKTAETRVELGILGLKSYPVVGCTLPHPLHVQSHRVSKLRDRMKLKRYLIIGVSALLSQTQKEGYEKKAPRHIKTERAKSCPFTLDTRNPWNSHMAG
jgi:hypothetical protein